MAVFIVFLVFIVIVILILSNNKSKNNSELYKIIELADQGDEEAKHKLNLLFEKGMTSKEHNCLRMETYKPKAEQGDINAQYWIGFLYSTVERNAERAKYWLTKAAEQGSIEAMRNLAFSYSKFLYEKPDDNYSLISLGFNKQEQLKWLNEAIAAGDAESMCDLAHEYMYNFGGIVEVDIAKALDLYTRAAEQNYARAYLGLSDIYRTIGTAYYDRKKQLEVLLKAMQCCDRDVYERASFDLGNLFGSAYMYNGQADEISDRKKAAYCFSLTYFLGNDYGRVNLEKLKYPVTKEELEQWKYDALNLVYNRGILER